MSILLIEYSKQAYRNSIPLLMFEQDIAKSEDARRV